MSEPDVAEPKEKIDHDKPLPEDLREFVEAITKTAQDIFNKDKWHGNIFFILGENADGEKESMVVDVTDLMKSPELKDKAAEIIRQQAEKNSATALMHFSESWVLDPTKIRDILNLGHSDKVRISEEKLTEIINSLSLSLHELYHIVHGTIEHSPFTTEAVVGTLDTHEGAWIVKFDIIREGKNVTLKEDQWVHIGPMPKSRFGGLLPKKDELP